MVNQNELDKLLGDSGDETPAATPAATKKDVPVDAVKLVEQEVGKVKEAFKQRLDSLQEKHAEEIAALTEKLKPLDALQQKAPEPQFNPQTVQDWQQAIKEEASKASNQAVDQIKQTAWKKAVGKLISTDQSYSTSDGKQKLSRVVELAKRIGVNDEFDSDSIYDSLEAAWAAENRQVLKEQARKAEQYRTESEISTVDLATSGGSGGSDPVRSSGDVQATASDVRAYNIYKNEGGEMTLAQFLGVRGY